MLQKAIQRTLYTGGWLLPACPSIMSPKCKFTSKPCVETITDCSFQKYKENINYVKKIPWKDEIMDKTILHLRLVKTL